MPSIMLSEHGLMRYRQRVRDATEEEIITHLKSLPRGKRIICARRERLKNYGTSTIVKQGGFAFVFGDCHSEPGTQYLVTVYKTKTEAARRRREAARLARQQEEEDTDGFYRFGRN